ncbi:hypothetical protein COV93_06715 [Candidatus Woesearchaeota archaeon CG11_big_fil_rev_8_21_14_0_20_43_8]|nr:MAG: hypothetical protein COV93_06715 [Candidatus Woesearchaeota archaeon CG11_big_fil_rev_8_21_14_0_20_43_8]PIO06743.1 MAG: hypothetical protein COT47_02935 [Candidatus Woesearchaeota archaeon CG08_land_8_20_14_0_20_43_7]
MKIDFHTHLTRHTQEGLYTDDASPEYLVSVMSRYSIEKAVVMATFFPHQNRGSGNMKMLDLISESDRFLMFGGLDVERSMDAGIQELRSIKDSISGIKLYPGYQDFYPHEEKMSLVYRLASELGIPVAFHSGETTGEGDFPESWDIDEDNPGQYLHYQTHPSHIGEVAKRFPSLDLVICHYGQPFTKSARDVLNKHPHIYTDVSGLWKTGKDDTEKEIRVTRKALKILAHECDPSQVLFASDFPIQSIEDSIEHIESMGYSTEDKNKVYYENAKRLLRL